MDELSTKFRVWLVPGKEPDWQGAGTIVQADPFTADAWTVVVRGNGGEFERFIKSHRDLFTLYERLTSR